MTAVPKLSWAEVCARRLERHGLSSPSTGVAEVVGALCAVHAQVLSAADLSIALRLPGATRTDVREALWTDRRVVKTRGPRGTVHLLRAEDLPMWTGALSALPPGRSPLPDDVRLTPGQTEAVLDAIGAALADAELTVDELTEAIVARTGAWAGDRVMEAFQDKWPRWRQVEHLAANRGVLCFGPNRGRKVTYTHPGRWLPGFRPTPGPAALAELLRRYLYAYGPATPGHFAHWLAAPRRWAGELFDSLSGELEPVEVEGQRAWVVAGDTEAPADPPDGVHLLPYFDAYTYSGHPRELLYPGRAAERVLTGNFQVLVVDGVAAGLWHQRRAGRGFEFTVEPLGRLTRRQRAELDARAARVAEILAAPAKPARPVVSIGTVTVGGHA